MAKHSKRILYISLQKAYIIYKQKSIQNKAAQPCEPFNKTAIYNSLFNL
jgi:hypothetical protein